MTYKLPKDPTQLQAEKFMDRVWEAMDEIQPNMFVVMGVFEMIKLSFKAQLQEHEEETYNINLKVN